MDDIKELRERYFNSLVLLTKKEDIMASLPQIEFQSFFSIVDGLMECLNDEIESVNQLLVEATNDEDKEELISELELLNLKLTTCKERKEEALKQEKNELEASKPNKEKIIIFATSNSERVYFENDLKSISEEYYGTVLECLNNLESGIIEDNEVKGRQLSTTNNKLCDIHEVKAFKVRVYYRILDSDLAYVFIARMKKDDFSKKDREAPALRNKNVNKEFDYLQKLIMDPDKKQQLIEKHLEIREEIIEFLNLQKRGNK